jgi:hypothetical protein
MLMPSRVALALQERGWRVRKVVPWLKRNAMPESVDGERWERHRVKVKAGAYPKPRGQDPSITRPGKVGVVVNYPGGRAEWADCPGCPKCAPNGGLVLRKGAWRPSTATEWVIMLSKSGEYYSDGEGVRIGLADSSLARVAYGWELDGNNPRAGETPGNGQAMGERYAPSVSRNRRDTDWWFESLDAIIAEQEYQLAMLKLYREQGGLLLDEEGEPLGLQVNPKGYKEAHFATYPLALCEPIMKASTSDKGNCPKCGRPWARVIERRGGKSIAVGKSVAKREQGLATAFSGYDDGSSCPSFSTLGWRPTCQCADADDPIPAVVLDPFAGTGTTLMAARKLGRKGVGMELSPSYIPLAVKRLGGPYEDLPESFDPKKPKGKGKKVKTRQEGLW